MLFSNGASKNSESSSRKHSFIKWGAILTTALVALIYAVVSTSLFPGIVVVFFMGLGAPGASLLYGILLLILFFVLYTLPIFVLVILFIKKKCLWAFLFNVIVMVLLMLFGGSFVKRPLELAASKAGVSLPDSAPAGILTLPDSAIPDEYFLGEKGNARNISGQDIYSKAFYSRSAGKGVIQMIYFMQQSKCSEFSAQDFEKGTCKAGECVIRINFSPASDGKINFRSKNVSYAIDDEGFCVRLNFSTSNEKEALTQEQMTGVVDSLTRVPGERVARKMEIPDGAPELFKTQLQVVQSALENYKIQNGSYKGYAGRTEKMALKRGDCVSALHLDVAPSGDSYVLYRLTCEDTDESFCIESGQKEISLASLSSIQQSYHCK